MPYPAHVRAINNYWISTEGRVWSRPRSQTPGGIIAAGQPDPGFYPKFRNIGIHTLVLTTFVGPRPPDYLARHLNGDSWDNRLVNLRWGTTQENALDRAWHILCRKHNYPRSAYVREQ